MKSIYEIYIPVKDQEQADRLKDICLEYGLPIFNEPNAFDVSEYFDYAYFAFETHLLDNHCFAVWFAIEESEIDNKTESTEEEFINILKEMKNGK